jgi:hypothetical protein
MTTSLVPPAADRPTMQVDAVAKAWDSAERRRTTQYRQAKSHLSGLAVASSSPQPPYAACSSWMAVPTRHEPKSEPPAG